MCVLVDNHGQTLVAIFKPTHNFPTNNGFRVAVPAVERDRLNQFAQIPKRETATARTPRFLNQSQDDGGTFQATNSATFQTTRHTATGFDRPATFFTIQNFEIQISHFRNSLVCVCLCVSVVVVSASFSLVNRSFSFFVSVCVRFWQLYKQGKTQQRVIAWRPHFPKFQKVLEMSIIQRLANMGDFFGLLMKIDPADVLKIAESVRVLSDDDADLKIRVLAGIDVADVLVEYTPTEADDMFVDWIAKLAESEGVWSIVDAVRELIDGRKVGELTIVADYPRGVTVGETDEETGEVQTIPVGVIVQVAVFVVQMIRLLKENK